MTRLAPVLALLAGLAAAGHAQNAVVTRNVNLRTGPSTATTVIELLEPQNELWLLTSAKTSGYFEVRTSDGSRGFVWANFIRITGDTTTPAVSGPPVVFRNCEAEGNATQPSYRAANVLKNRVTAPTAAAIDPAVTLDAMLAPGNDEARWDATRGASIVGFVVDVKATGAESVNCGETQSRYTDTHIDLVIAANVSAGRRRVVVEITPRWREFMSTQGEDWSQATLRQLLERRWVRFTGWLFFDFHHRGEAQNTATTGTNIWRATAWEIHPVTSFQLCPGNSPQSC